MFCKNENVFLGTEIARRFAVITAVMAFAPFVRMEAKEGLAPFPEWSEPRRVTEGPKEHLLASYFAIDSWSPNKRYISVLETELNGRLPEAGERCTIGFDQLAIALEGGGGTD